MGDRKQELKSRWKMDCKNPRGGLSRLGYMEVKRRAIGYIYFNLGRRNFRHVLKKIKR